MSYSFIFHVFISCRPPSSQFSVSHYTCDPYYTRTTGLPRIRPPQTKRHRVSLVAVKHVQFADRQQPHPIDLVHAVDVVPVGRRRVDAELVLWEAEPRLPFIDVGDRDVERGRVILEKETVIIVSGTITTYEKLQYYNTFLNLPIPLPRETSGTKQAGSTEQG